MVLRPLPVELLNTRIKLDRPAYCLKGLRKSSFLLEGQGLDEKILRDGLFAYSDGLLYDRKARLALEHQNKRIVE